MEDVSFEHSLTESIEPNAYLAQKPFKAIESNIRWFSIAGEGDSSLSHLPCKCACLCPCVRGRTCTCSDIVSCRSGILIGIWTLGADLDRHRPPVDYSSQQQQIYVRRPSMALAILHSHQSVSNLLRVGAAAYLSFGIYSAAALPSNDKQILQSYAITISIYLYLSSFCLNHWHHEI